MKIYYKILVAIPVLALATAAQANTVAGITVNLAGTGGTSWVGNPLFSTWPNPTPLASSEAGNAENNFGSPGVVTGNEQYGNGGLAEGFSLPVTTTLTDLQFGFTGSGNSAMGISIYDLGLASSYGGQHGYSSFLPTYNGGTALNILPNGLQFSFSGSAMQVADLSFSGTPVVLLGGEQYAVALEPAVTTTGIYWGRSNIGTSDTTLGQAYYYSTPSYISTPGVYSALYGGIEQFSLAVNQVPEPTIMALMGAGIALSGVLIRRRKA